MGSSSDDEWRRRHCRGPADAEPPEEGELVPGCDDDSDVNTEDYYNNHEYYSSTDTDETTSDCNYYARPVIPASSSAATGPSSAAAASANNNGHDNASSSPVVAAMFACPICGKEFRSRKAVCGHMKVHQHGNGTTIGRRNEQQQGIAKHNKGIKKRNAAAVTGGWGGTGKRGSSGCWSWSRPASPSPQSDQSMAIVVANPSIVLQPMPLAFAAPNPLPPVRMESATPNQSSSVAMASATPNASSVPIASTMTNVSDESSSAKPMHNDAMETVVAGAANPPTQAVVHDEPPPPSPDAKEERVQLPSVHHPHRPIAPARAVAGRQNPDGYTCRRCGVWFLTHQGLGGHIAGHKNRELAAVPCRRDAKPKKEHVCKTCGEVFSAGVQLGGHMRKHYTGAPIVPKKKPRLDIQVQPLPPPAEQGTLEPAPGPAVAGRLRLFGFDIVAAGAQGTAAQAQEDGVDIVAGAQGAAAQAQEDGVDINVAGAQGPAAQTQEQGSSATEAPSASTGGEQQ